MEDLQERIEQLQGVSASAGDPKPSDEEADEAAQKKKR
jgi:hypothetical protein